MHFLYEAEGTDGKPLMGKIDANSAEEVGQLLTKSGLTVKSVAPVLAKSLPVQPQFAPPGPQKAAQTSPSAMPVWMPSNEPRATPVDLSLLDQPDALDQTSYALAPLNYAATPVLKAPTPVQHTPSANTNLGGKIILSGNAASLSHSAALSQRSAKSIGYTSPVTQPDHLSYVGGVTDRDRMMFFQQLASLVRSGMTVYSALDSLAPRTPAKNLSQVAREMATAARNGGMISEIMAGYPVLFPTHITATVRAGELGGFLEISMAEIALNYQRKIDLYRGAWIPKLMATQAFFAIAIVLPFMATILSSMDVVANFLKYVRLELTIYLPIAFALYFCSKFIFRRLQVPQLQKWRDNLALKVPPFAELQRQESLGSFVRMLRRLHEAGVAPIAAWEGAMDVSSNLVIREKLQNSYAMMQSGASFSEAFTETGLFNNEIENLVITGQQSGQIVEMLDGAADYYEQQTVEASKRAKFTMLRMGVIGLLVFGGAAVCWFAYSYGKAVLNIPHMMFPELD